MTKKTDPKPKPREMHKLCEGGCGRMITATLSARLCTQCQGVGDSKQRRIGLRAREAK